jgi:hypothetical protein
MPYSSEAQVHAQEREIEFTAKRDPGTNGLRFEHYIVGNTMSTINGGIFIQKGQILPDRIVINIPRKEEEGDV